MNEPLISICVPAYKKPQYVVRLIDSVLKQDYKNVEVIVSDDSPDEDTKRALEPYQNKLTIRYYHNQPAFTSPRNWNHALNKAQGDLVVLMHQDDWYEPDNALSTYVETFRSTKADFVFCQNTGVDENGKRVVLQAIPSLLKRLSKTPDHLLLAQVIGPPSNTMLRRTVDVRYDERYIWLVDVDYYTRLLKKGYRYHYIEKNLVNIGLHEDQTTAFCRANSDIIFKENIWFAKKLGNPSFGDIRIFDYYWRLLRNYKIRSVADMEANGVQQDEILPIILHMLHAQKKFSSGLLKNGLISKTLMTVNFLSWKTKAKKP